MLKRRWLEVLKACVSKSYTTRNRKHWRRGTAWHGNSEWLEDRTLLTAPYSSDDSYSVASGSTLTVNPSGVLSNDMDMEFDPLTAQLVMQPMMGTFSLNPNGSFVYSAPSAYSGNVTFSYRAFDGMQTGNTATVTITITGSSGGGGGGSGGGGTNQPPTALSDSFYVEQNSSAAKLPVLWNDSDPESNSLSISSVTSPQHGSANSQYDYSSGNNVVAYTPTSAYTGSDSLNYTISDGTATASTSATLTVHAVDNTIAQARPLSLQNNVRLTTGGIIGDGPQSWSDVDLYSVSLTAGEVIKFDIDSAKIDAGGSYGSLNSLLRLFNGAGTQIATNDNGTDPDTSIASNDSYLTWTVTTAGTYYIGVSDSSNSTYNPTSSGGGYSMVSGAYLLNVLREVPNLPPVATNDTATTHHGTVVTVPVLANDTDPNGDALAITTVGSAAHGTTQVVTVSGVNQARYTPTAGYTGTDSVTYTISDPAGATSTATVSVTVSNSNPVATPETFEAVAGVSRVVSFTSGVLAN